uniref:Hypoxia-inducible factor 1-alpha-like protein n=1 Tax=Halichondria panicea TaxID=6063 RepID=A0A6C0SNX0_HALPA|nr:hypoxia-inducible factor 1-alpha-like protein [Halichondria panicea]
MKCSRFKVTNTIAKTPGYKLVYISGSLKLSGNEAFLVVVVRPVSPPSILELKVEGNMFVTHYSMEMKCTFFDGRLNQLMGYRKKDLLGDVVFTLHHHDDTEATMECSRGVMSRGEGLSGYFRFLTKHGYYVWLQTRATVMYDSRTGKPSYIVCMNFLIDKEKGDQVLKNRAITAIEEDNDLVIKELDSRSHDPFPLVSREDGKVVNPLDEADQSVTKNEVTSSSSPDISLPDSNPSSTVFLPEESMLPDSTSSEPDSSMGGMIRTHTGTTSRTSDAGYSSSNSCAGGRGMFSPNSGAFEVSSFSSNSPLSDVSMPQRKSSWENPSSGYMTSPLGCVSEVGSSESIPAATHGIFGVLNSNATIPNINSSTMNISSNPTSSHHQHFPIMNSSPQAITSSHTDQPHHQNSHLSSLLLSDTSGPNQGYSHSNSHQVNDTPQPGAATHLLGKRHTAGGLHIKQEDTLTQERFVRNGQLNQPGGYSQTDLQQQFPQSNDLYSNVPPLLNMYTPDFIDSSSQSHGHTWAQTMPQGDKQYFTSPINTQAAPHMNVPYQQHDFLPDWQGGRVTVKNEFHGCEQSVADNNQQFQQVQTLNGQIVTSQPATMFPQQHSSTFNTALQPQHPITAISANIQASCTVSNQHLPMGVPSLPDQLPLLTGEDLRLLDDIGSYA